MRRLSRKVPLSGKFWKQILHMSRLFSNAVEWPTWKLEILRKQGIMKADKSFEPDATAAFKKLKQKQQVGCGEKGEEKIADAGTDNRGEEQSTNENHQEKGGSLSCGQLVEDFFQLLGFKDARYCDKALGLGNLEENGDKSAWTLVRARLGTLANLQASDSFRLEGLEIHPSS
ncbi:hypothetical protein POTOM_025178 [Populus tomentosa]|uniref:Uncharacterized protein n=1 Tax=Populus tomentosa TaxID=118781 RepID=A0A8X8CNE9_POPTO|nr:hypothetical protein POTOM_025178 [Populus tomentosa]